jgi:hypothetical protein
VRGIDRAPGSGVRKSSGSFQGFDKAGRRGIEQLLQGAAVLQATLHFRNQGVGDIEGKALVLDMAGKNPAGMLFPALTSAAVFANATSAAQAERAESGRPEVGNLSLEPALDIGGRVELVGHEYLWHIPYILAKKIIAAGPK